MQPKFQIFLSNLIMSLRGWPRSGQTKQSRWDRHAPRQARARDDTLIWCRSWGYLAMIFWFSTADKIFSNSTGIQLRQYDQELPVISVKPVVAERRLRNHRGRRRQ